ncbi:MAG: Prolyl-tRNA synthetase [Candidatus Nomurabacteria bacterium GW2011_GWF2_35_66]|uniref:Proline--tRNA ligase n=1 Tax=Candidatus Nomurabacteria bacterium GW2011_GWE1_35_16 TaxID=1618761 RepID=A0A0G0DTK8_9BACT|nr:MAG: Prolyl-tRNA synthetase [Candidatus Nomurabacteria bacterium GW2011_GWF1_34_20]KKP63143.1 MAG: Prolyl-tRNA synthetase [Candidatus Nomurabacteria bacterium GW2011_GWE2_34_25]KKP66330.1 MAG: Prolyl-tRNA synthetase [Candidatus Nomurabacteria bacterium GW2011_GWE1_35_16]KKP83229.1 MAG: Prolyl-tRNA synthetase [Candidatus Nomurabacteria bacterium GW2011_GWF2_35_66]HAE36320.1 prolyl-tRNA synthetase [Candidatus Nomurabacteria bacterium]
MRQSQLFTKTKKESPADEVSLNAELLIRAGFINKEMAGVYSYLPLGLRVIKKIENIIREEMNAIGGIEMKTSIIQSKEVWEKSGRWSDDVVDNWFKTKLKNGTEVGLSFTNEEAYSNILKQYISSYKDLPIYPYDFKDIFRNETRSKSGILRGREFYWKALYSFSKNAEEHNVFYEKSKEAYKNIFNKVGIGHLTYLTFASGGTFSKFSHEFQTITSAGEDTIYVDPNNGIAVNKEVYNDEVLESLGLKKEDMVENKAIEVGNIFSLGTKFSTPFDLKYKDEKGEDNLVVMGCYGIGLGRLMGTIVETLSDDKGIIWPESIAPFKVHLLSLGDDENVKNRAEELYNSLTAKGIEVLFDDRTDISAGEKFADSDLIGVPYRVVVSKRSLADGGFEIKKRVESNGKIITIDELVNLLEAKR